jgi:pyruvate/2-oxoglutarate dehydrogenase complex dihydrolipoamide dehydrogenase (E3) component
MSLVDAYEVLIVGGGRAGQALAADLGGVGHRVALIERRMIGGTCINVDCIPTKTLAASARVAELVSRAGQFGIRVDGWESDLAGVLANKRAVVSGVVDLVENNMHESLGDRFILGEARFVAHRTVEVTPSDGSPRRRLFGEKVFVSLRAGPAMPSVPGLLKAATLTSETVLDLDFLPEHLLILGGGFVGWSWVRYFVA